MLEDIRNRVRESITASPEKMERYFKTKSGSYGEHDRFLGVTNPVLRLIAKEYRLCSREVLQQLLQSPFNEERLLALLIIVDRYAKASYNEKESWFRLYMANKKSVNNWNLVDCSAHLVVGAYLFDKDRAILFELAQSDSLWDRRIAIISTLFFIRKNDFETTLALAKVLLHDTHDLLHKAVGWMLREVGHKDEPLLLVFLNEHAVGMPRTMLRYAIERLTPEVRKGFLARR